MNPIRTLWTLFSVAFQERFAYKIAFVIWRFRQLLGTFLSLSIWLVLFNNQDQLFNYDQNQMITYIFVVTVLQSLILTSALHNLTQDVYSGKLSLLLLKPISLFSYLGMYELSDKILNMLFVIGEAVILYLIFQPIFIVPDLATGLLLIVWVLAAMWLNFCITLLFGAIGFWSPDVWGPKFFFFMILEFAAGKLYPLDILPEIIQKILYLTPFPYFSYAQSQLFLGRLTPQEIMLQSGALLFWTVSAWILVKIIWQRGLRDYAAAGQ